VRLRDEPSAELEDGSKQSYEEFQARLRDEPSAELGDKTTT